MNPINFPESNATFKSPTDLDASQVMTINGYIGFLTSGSLDGAPVFVTAWKPTPEEVELIRQGNPIFLSFLSHGLPPHFPCMTFQEAVNPV